LHENGQAQLIPSNDLSSHIQALKDAFDETGEPMPEELDLLSFPAVRLVASRITTIDTMQEAYDLMRTEDVETLFVSGAHGKTKNRIYGILTTDHIEKSSTQAG